MVGGALVAVVAEMIKEEGNKVKINERIKNWIFDGAFRQRSLVRVVNVNRDKKGMVGGRVA